MLENRGLDPITGYPINPYRTFQVRRHHISYDKSLLDSQYLLLMTYTSHALIHHPPKQTYYHESIRNTLESAQDEVWCKEIKDALSRGLPPPHWTNPNHPWHVHVNPNAVRLFNQRNSQLNTFGFRSLYWGFVGNP